MPLGRARQIIVASCVIIDTCRGPATISGRTGKGIFELERNYIKSEQEYMALGSLHLQEARIGCTDRKHGAAIRGEELEACEAAYERSTHINFLAFFHVYFYEASQISQVTLTLASTSTRRAKARRRRRAAAAAL